MPIVCDTSPLSYLVLIGEVSLLPELYGTVLIPRAVERELAHPDGPLKTRQWIAESPSWLDVVSAEEPREEPNSVSPDLLQVLDPGERAAIRLAAIADVRLFVIDERDGRRVAKRLDLPVTGTIGVLDVAAAADLIDVPDMVARLRKTSFRALPDLYRWLLKRHR